VKKAVRGALLPLHPTHYERLGLPETAPPAEVQAAWEALAPGLPPEEPMAPSLVTPGVTETPALQASAIRLAYRVLSHPGRRAVYDRWLAAQRAEGTGWWQRVMGAASAALRRTPRAHRG
jgi:DnaJ-class molecular chaperone